MGLSPGPYPNRAHDPSSPAPARLVASMNSGAVHHQEEGVVGGLRAERNDARSLADAEGVDELPGEEHALGAQRMLGAVVVDARLGTAHESDAIAHATERIAVTVPSTSVSASASVRQNGGPSMIRSPSAPSTCPVDE